MSDPSAPDGERRSGLIAGLICYTVWGFLPLYFHLLSGMGVGVWEMIGERLLWAFPWALGLVILSGQWPQVLAVARKPRTMGLLALSTLAILTNWIIYVAAVASNHIIEAALGYYINPLLNMAVGALFFRERLSTEGRIAIGLATIGVAVQAVALGRLPLISLGLAVSFCLYGILRKQVKADAQTGLFVECAYLAPVGLAYVIWMQHSGAGHLLASPATTAMLMLAGPATVVPLALFAFAARRLPLTAVGFLQFIAPTIGFIIGVAVGEPLTPMRILSFGFIWAGVAVFGYGAWRRMRLVAKPA
ncbi:MAG: RarD protein superfamily transporter [Caulobacter sp.]|nr:RarD protein superfamily transporter [Caulobacter sp.]